jgi:hypothetical protein
MGEAQGSAETEMGSIAPELHLGITGYSPFESSGLWGVHRDTAQFG